MKSSENKRSIASLFFGLAAAASLVACGGSEDDPVALNPTDAAAENATGHGVTGPPVQRNGEGCGCPSTSR